LALPPSPEVEVDDLDIVVRRATADDAAAVARLINEVILAGLPSLLDTPFGDDEERAYIAALPARGFIHVAELPDGSVIGSQTIVPAGDFATHQLDHVATIGTWIDARYRRRGVGRRLAEASFAAARALGYEKIFTDVRDDNVDSLAFHVSLGFRVAGTARRQAKAAGRYHDVWLIEQFL
jgi:L-amino acid N-acyltransferase YncA